MEPPDEQRRHRTRDGGEMVFGHPVAAIPPLLGVLREIDRIVQRSSRIGTLADRCEVEHRQRGMVTKRHGVSPIDPGVSTLGRVAATSTSRVSRSLQMVDSP